MIDEVGRTVPLCKDPLRPTADEILTMEKYVQEVLKVNGCLHHTGVGSMPQWVGSDGRVHEAIEAYVFCGDCGEAYRPNWDGGSW